MRGLSFVFLSLALCSLGCEKKPRELTPKEKAERAALANPDLKGGTRHDPAVEKAAIADGTYICDMGKVHFSRADKGDGLCPICGMDLVVKK
ncbi:MAG: hypothetical protein AAGA56_29675, partial [Myxococcota bacterium]